MKRSTIALACAAAGASVFATLVRPRFLRWGRVSTRDQPGLARRRVYARTQTQATRAVTFPTTAKLGFHLGTGKRIVVTFRCIGECTSINRFVTEVSF